VQLADFPISDTAYPHLTFIRQADVEAVLADTLAERGVSIERDVELVNLATEQHSGVRVRLRGAGRVGATFDFLVGCDGADSTVRCAAGIRAHDGGYRREVVLADVELDGDLTPGTAHVSASWDGLVFLFPLGEQATWRLLVTRKATGARRDESVPPDALQQMLDSAHAPARIRHVAWSSIVSLRQRLADRYRRDAVFLAGDAAHVHSPAGGQGMNTGIQDAINLGWKLASADDSTHPAVVLDSYEQERRPVARTSIAMTNLIFWAESGLDPLAALARTALVPLAAPLLPTVLGWQHLTAQGFRTLAQLDIGYPRSSLSIDDGPTPSVHTRAGQRLPDMSVTVGTGPKRLHELLAQPGLHLLLLRDASGLDHLGEHARVHVHRLLDRPGRGLIGVRPDGYVGLRTSNAESPQVARWLRLTGAVPAKD
jgi:2-polyprenyl-6-methoxyphenol hydroxylase-like FAD-dependent oxidoreductase